MKNRLLSSSAPSSFSILLDETCLRHARLETWKNGQSICEHALQPPGIWYVLEGQVKLVRLLTGGERKVLHLVSENHFFFEALFFQHEARVMTAVAVAPCRTAFFLWMKTFRFAGRCFLPWPARRSSAAENALIPCIARLTREFLLYCVIFLFPAQRRNPC